MLCIFISVYILFIVSDTPKVFSNFLLIQSVKMEGRQPKCIYFLSSEWYSPWIPQKYFLYREVKDLWVCFEKKTIGVYQDCILKVTILSAWGCLGSSHGWFHIYWRFPSAITDWSHTYHIWWLSCLLGIGLWCALAMIQFHQIKCLENLNWRLWELGSLEQELKYKGIQSGTLWMVYKTRAGEFVSETSSPRDPVT